MLVQLDVRDFAIIDHVRLRLGPGFNVMTGETGAGKSIVIDAVGQLIGERADTDQVRAGVDEARIEGVFEPGAARAALRPVLEEYGIALEDDDELILAREIAAEGRSVGRINGRAVPIKALAAVGRRLVDIHGQSENLSLKRESEHLLLLDRYAGLEDDRRALAEEVAELRRIAKELGALKRDDAAQARRADMLSFQVEEIEAAELSVEEEETLLRDRKRLANAERLAQLADEAYEALRGGALAGRRDEAALAAVDLVELALESVEALARIDPALEPAGETLTESATVLADVAVQLRDYRDEVDFDPGRLEEVEDRLKVISDLKRKYGPDVAAVLAWADEARAELDQIEGAEERIEALTAAREAQQKQVGKRAAALSEARRAAGEELARAVECEIEALGMPDSRFEVALERREDPDGVPVDGSRLACDATGIDLVSFRVSTNPGEPPRALVRVTSGGETSRVMLALKSILSAADAVPTLIFDEIDAGIGGRIGGVVGQKLWALTDRHQVLCVTHLPQVASFGDCHYQVRKGVSGGRTTTDIVAVEEDDRISELTHMLGSGTNVARENALQLLQQSELWKVTERHARSDA